MFKISLFIFFSAQFCWDLNWDFSETVKKWFKWQYCILIEYIIEYLILSIAESWVSRLRTPLPLLFTKSTYEGGILNGTRSIHITINIYNSNSFKMGLKWLMNCERTIKYWTIAQKRGFLLLLKGIEWHPFSMVGMSFCKKAI